MPSTGKTASPFPRPGALRKRANCTCFRIRRLAAPREPRSTARRTRLNTPATAYHESGLLAETVERLAPASGKVMLDGTLGGGGHTAALLAAGARVIGLDQDPEALEFAQRRL